MPTQTLSLDQVTQTVRQRHAALSPLDFTDQPDLYQFAWPQDRPPQMQRLTQDRTLYLSPRAETQLLQRLGVPVTFFRRLPANLKWAVANHLNQEAPGGALLRTVRGDTVRAFLSEQYTPIDDLDVLPLVADILGDDDVTIERLDFSDDTTHLRVLFPRQLSEARPGDVLTTGLHLTNSEVGYRAVHVDALVHRLICSNGLVRAESQGRTTIRHVGQAARLKDHLAVAIRDARDNARGLVREFRESVAHAIADPEALLRRHAREAELTKEQLQAALAAFALEPDPTLFGAVNAITRAAQAEGTYEERYQMERTASAPLARGR